ncbi:epoxyqueuosine reductase [Candidatus Bathyarchaeota archaeon]|nr:epoxyqueuosine reductase [Candidatus Bathyarchaeota archaeon]
MNCSQPVVNMHTSIMEELFLCLAERGYQGRVISVKHLPELKEDIEKFQTQSLFDKEFYQECLAWFDFRIPDSLPEAKSIIIVAVPRPQSQAIFTWNGKRKAFILPPTYAGYDETTKQIQDFLAKILSKRGYSVAPTALPLKLLAVRGGLGEYGRNNICYVSGMGSFLQLVGAYSDMPCQEDSWQEMQMMQRCEHCQACRLNCPTGAISSDRFLLHAERCIVFHGERKGTIPFPAWIDPSWHNCLYGCLRCQKVCPEDRNFLQWFGEKKEFSQEETALLLEGASYDQLSAATLRKLEHLSLAENLDSIPRNLGVFLGKHANA